MDSVERYIIARWAYSIGEEYISDPEYDRLEQELKSRGLAPEYTSRGWSEDICPYDLLKKYNLDEYITNVIYSFSTESIESLNSDELVRARLFRLSGPTRLSYKLDGFSLRLSYFDGRLVFASLRNRKDGKVTSLVNLMSMFQQTISIKGKVMITGELYLKNIQFEAYKQLRGIVSQRNGVSTAIANGDIEFLGYRCYNIYSSEFDNKIDDKYKVLQSMGFAVPKNVMVTDYASLLKGIEVLGKSKGYYDAPTDGVVLENETVQLALRVGAWKEECNFSYVKDYVFNRGMYGDSMLCSIRPVFVNNKTVSEISVTNPQTVIDNNLRVGLPIAFVERSSVNSILDVTKTQELQAEYEGREEEFRTLVHEKYK